MDKVYEEHLKKTIISFKWYRDALQKVEQSEGVRYKKKRLKHGATLDVVDCRSVRGALLDINPRQARSRQNLELKSLIKAAAERQYQCCHVKTRD